MSTRDPELERLLRDAAGGDEAALDVLCDALVRRGHGRVYGVVASQRDGLVRAIASVTDWGHRFDGRCPDRSSPQLRDLSCQVCNLMRLAEATDSRVWEDALRRLEAQEDRIQALEAAWEEERRRRRAAELRLAEPRDGQPRVAGRFRRPDEPD